MGYRQNMLAEYLRGQAECPSDYRNMYAANALLDDLVAAAGREGEKVLEETVAEFLSDARIAETLVEHLPTSLNGPATGIRSEPAGR